jgi:drug/metabolite transporter (DMT)-like permease
MAIAFAIAAAFCFASGGVTVMRGMQHTNIVTALLISLPATALVTVVFAIFDSPETVTIGAIIWFGAAGLLGDGVGRASFFKAVELLGPSTTTPIQTASYPLIALLGGVLLFSETLVFWQIVGVVAIVAGIWAVTGGTGSQTQPERRLSARQRWRWAYLLPVLAGVVFASSDLLRKSALEETPHPAFGAAVASTTVLIVWMIVSFSVPGIRRQLKPGPGWQWLIATGAFVAFGLLAVFNALERGDVSVVGPVIIAQPVIVVMLSMILLRDLERVTLRIVVGAVMTVVGVTLIALS